MNAIQATDISGLKLLRRGKVRDVYEVDDDHLLIITTDRLSAFDWVLNQPIPGKGEVLKRLWAHAESHLPNDGFRDYTQAMMDLGATLCTRKDPSCSRCPLHDGCAARAVGSG